MQPIFIGIAGGTGAGKSSLCTALQDKYHDKIGLIQLDDYFKPAAEVPMVNGMESWDSPESLYLEKLARDLVELSQGHPVVINTKNAQLNPEYVKTDKRIPVEFHPKPIMLVEGYLTLYDERVRKLLNTTIWLETDHDTRWARRVHFKNSEYEKKVLKPMHKKFVEPTKQYAEHVIDVSNLSKEEVFSQVENILKAWI